MKRILILNLRRFGDIFYSAEIMRGLLEKYPEAKISYLTYKESVRATHVFAKIDNRFTVDREKLGLLLKGGPFAYAHAFKELRNCLQGVGFDWDLIVNVSNCPASAYLTAYLSHNKKNYAGVRYNANGNLEFSDDWIAWANELMVDMTLTPFSYMEVFQKSLGLNSKSKSKTKIELVYSKEHEVSTQNVFTKLHELGSTEHIYVVALQLSASTPEKSASFKEALQLIQSIFDHPNLYPLLLVGPSEEERARAKSLNEVLDNALFVVEADFIGLNSVLKSTDILLTVDTSVKHLSAIQNTKLLELYFNPNLLFKMPSNSGSHLVLIDRLRVGENLESCTQYIANCCAHILKGSTLKPTVAGVSLFEYAVDKGFSLLDTMAQEIREMHAYYTYHRACVVLALELKLDSLLFDISKELLGEYREILSNILAAYREINQLTPLSSNKIFATINNLEPSRYSTSPFKTLLTIRKVQALSKFTNDVKNNRNVFKEFLLRIKDEFSHLKQIVIDKQGHTPKKGVNISTTRQQEYEI